MKYIELRKASGSNLDGMTRSVYRLLLFNFTILKWRTKHRTCPADWQRSRIAFSFPLIFAVTTLGVCLLVTAPLQAQTISNPTNTSVTLAPAPTVQGDVQNIFDIIKGGETNWYVGAYGLYAPGLQKKAGGGLAAAYPLSQYVFGSLRMDYVNGGFWMPSGSATFQIPIKVTSWLTVAPFAYAGVGVPVSGATVSGFTLPGKTPQNNNGQPTAILGYGGSVLVYQGKTSKAFINSIYILADQEEWTGFPGKQYRVGVFLNKKF